ncbi:MAG: ABC transporter permease [Acidobacteriota bacterium]|nr:ABC transporter permease [Acidobacteriota bacterium]
MPKWTVQNGDFFSVGDVRTAARVIVVGQTIAENLFPALDPIETLRYE